MYYDEIGSNYNQAEVAHGSWSRGREASLPAGRATDTQGDKEDLSFSSILQELATLARVMREEVLDASGRLRRDISLREVRETFVATANLLSIIAKSQETLDRSNNINLFQTALIDTLQELDLETKGNFLDSFDRRLEQLMA